MATKKKAKVSKKPKGKAAKTKQRKASSGKGAKRSTAGMSTKTTKPKRSAAGTEKRLSALDAAAQVLKRTGKPMRTKELIAAMAEQGLWESPGGKTPWATLYSSMTREIAMKVKDSRFKKVERGMFAARGVIRVQLS